MSEQTYIKKGKKFSGILFVRALPNEYLVAIGKKNVNPILGGKKLKLFQRFLRVPAYVQKLNFSTDNANIDYQGIGIDGYASWRINPENPSTAISTLDFFDETDPMEKTNQALITICIEAVRHVIANMSIEQALKNKDEIAENLKNQLQIVEKKWGIVFDQVGIEKVRIMSDKLFKDLQSDFRNKLRQESETKRITTDRNIAKEDNSANEKTRLEKIETEQKVGLIKIENDTKLKHREIEESKIIADKERIIREENFRKEQEFNLEKEQKEYDLKVLKKDLEIKIQENEINFLKIKAEVETLKNNITEKQIAVDELKKNLEQKYSSEELSARFIEQLPEIFSSIHIDNYSVLESGNNESVSPFTKILNELIFTLKNSGIEFNKKE